MCASREKRGDGGERRDAADPTDPHDTNVSCGDAPRYLRLDVKLGHARLVCQPLRASAGSALPVGTATRCDRSG